MEEKEVVNAANYLLHIFTDEFERLKQNIRNNNQYPGALPLGALNMLLWIFDYYVRKNYNLAQVIREFKEINGEYQEFIAAHKKEYLNYALDILRFEIEAFHPEMDFADGYDCESIIERRTRIENITRELKLHINISKELETVSLKDEILREKFWVAKTKKTYSPEDLEYAPVEYWWRHLISVYGEPDPVTD